jgi:phage tail-like protein
MATSEFPKNAHRFDPYKNFKFRVSFNNKVVAGISKVSPLKRTTQVVTHREGGDPSTPRHSPGNSAFDPITLERGVTFDLEFELWANLIFNTDGDAAVSLKNYKRDVIIDVLNLQGVKVKAYKIFRAWVSEYIAVPQLDSNANATMIESIILQNEGWQRDDDVKEQPET